MPPPVVEIPYSNASNSRHHRIMQSLLARLRFSDSHMQNRQTSYEDLEDQFLAYIPERDVDVWKRNARDLEGIPQYTTIQIPYTYAEVMTMYTYIATVALGRKPLLQYNGRHGEGQKQKLAVEAIMNYQMLNGDNMVPLHAWVLDSLKYGRGVIWNYWDEHYSYFTKLVDRPIQIGGLTLKTVREEVQERILQYMGNRLFTSRPQEFFPDPRVPTAYLQDGEFVGRRVRFSWNQLVRGDQEGRYFNIDQARRLLKSAGLDRERGSSKIDMPADENVWGAPPSAETPKHDVQDVGYIDGHEFYVEIIPREWLVGDSSRPQKWVFTFLNEELLIEARPHGAYHDKFPCFTLEPEFDGYSLHSRAPGEIIKPMEDTLTWLFNTHFYNVRKVLNDQFLVDPSRIEMTDVIDPLPGGVIRAKPAAYGTDMKGAISQLPVMDVTRQHIADSGYVLDILQRIDGVNDSMQGLMAHGGRKTATEVRQTNTFGVSRMQTKVEYLSAMGFMPLGQAMLQITQQYYDEEMKFRIAGDLVRPGSDPFVDVTPDAIAGAYDFVPIEGDIPLDRFALASVWRQITADLMRVPEIATQMGIDIPAILFHTAKLAGATDIEQFRIQAVPDEMLAQQAAAGNVVPLGGQGGGPTARETPVEGDERAASRIPVPAQITGLGPAG